jgi:uncharacterized protein (TIGR02444 family)
MQDRSVGEKEASAFWKFSLLFYRRPGVSEACLTLQEVGGADVNILLYLLFVARSNKKVGYQELERIEQRVSAWREGVVRPIRALRVSLKGGAPPVDAQLVREFREKVKRLELEAEWVEQRTLESMFSAPPIGSLEESPIAAARASLAAYADLLESMPREQLETLISSFSDWTTNGG